MSSSGDINQDPESDDEAEKVLDQIEDEEKEEKDAISIGEKSIDINPMEEEKNSQDDSVSIGQQIASKGSQIEPSYLL